MRLKVHNAAANEEIVSLVNEGYAAIAEMQTLYNQKKDAGHYDDTKDTAELGMPMNIWAEKVIAALTRIFPTQLEINLFSDPEIPFGAVSGDYKYQSMILRCRHFVRGLNKIRLNSVPEYTDLPLEVRMYIEDIDSFRKVRDVNPAIVTDLLKDGYLDHSEDFVQTALERILSVPFHKKDWGGEETAFLLKGNGLKVKHMEIKHCGVNGDQILRLCNSPARLYIVQYVGMISESVIADIDGKVRQARAQGKEAWYCIMDGQDTARVLRAYNQL